jgi:uncharacterized OB-fold protein
MAASTRPVHDGLFEVDADGTLHLVGGYSATSGQYHFPLLETCPYSGATDVERVRLTRDATLWAWTAVTAAPPGYTGTVPYGFGVVELSHERLRVITRLTEADPAALSFGQPMRAVADIVAIDDDGNDVITWAFAASADAP